MITQKDRILNNRQAEAWKLFGISKRRAAIAAGLGLIVLLGAFLRFYELGAHSIGNTYYAATVQSMLTSWHNFFFVSFEPGGSVTVDKPPLGFWIQAVSAYFLGVNGFALALPQALAGVLSIPLLYALVKRQFGAWAGLFAALVLAIMPVTVSTERNNTIDGLLLFVLLLATWAFLRAVRLGRFRYLLLGVFLIGLGFNIKMLQAFMPLPALYALYLLGAPHRWWKRIAHLALATLVLLAVSLSWAIAVDLTPAENRPYIGSSENNTVMELIVGHNGLRRLIPMGRGSSAGSVGSPSQSAGVMAPPNAGPPGQLQGPPLPLPGGGQPGQFPPGQPPQGPGGGTGPRNPKSQEVGEPGALRLFTEPLVTEAGWLLPLALLGIPLTLMTLGWQWPLSDKHLALVLWGGWLLPELVYFSLTSGLFHAYYLIMLGPPVAALVGATAWTLWRTVRQRRWFGWTLLVLLTGATIAFQVMALWGHPDYVPWLTIVAALVLMAGLGLLALVRLCSPQVVLPRSPQVVRTRSWLGRTALTLVLASLMVAPLTWSALTTLNENPNVALPRSGPGDNQRTRPSRSDALSASQQTLLDFLLDRTDADDYLVATLTATDAAPYILATQRPVLTFGGFKGSDDVVGVDQLAQIVADGELRFVLGRGLEREKPEIAAWLNDHCTTVSRPASGPGQDNILYDCGHYYAQAQLPKVVL